MEERMKLADIRKALEALQERIVNRRKMETRGQVNYREWTEELTKCRDLIDLVELAETDRDFIL